MLQALRHLLRSGAFEAIAYGVIVVFLATLFGVELLARALRLRLARLARFAWRLMDAKAKAVARLYSRVRTREQALMRPADLTLVAAGRTAADASLSTDVAVRPVAAARSATDVSLSTDVAVRPLAAARSAADVRLSIDDAARQAALAA
jgi:hypothetical protein